MKSGEKRAPLKTPAWEARVTGVLLYLKLHKKSFFLMMGLIFRDQYVRLHVQPASFSLQCYDKE